ncbi:MAG: hypothetical protein ACKOCQ_02290 [Candidatus Nitrosotenuis sp.]
MKKEYVVVRIDASPDGAPYVIVSLQATKDFKETQGFPQSPYGGGPGVMGFTNMDDMMKSLNKMLGGMGGMPTNMTTMKLDMREYKELSLSVGDKVHLEISKAEISGI